MSVLSDEEKILNQLAHGRKRRRPAAYGVVGCDAGSGETWVRFVREKSRNSSRSPEDRLRELLEEMQLYGHGTAGIYDLREKPYKKLSSDEIAKICKERSTTPASLSRKKKSFF